jgi:quercetin dioxygenase-like cupin family protein
MSVLSNHMPVVRSGEEMAQDARPPQGRFTGRAEQRPIHVREGDDTVRVSFVRFEQGSVTHWHSHGGGQVLHVVEGEARVRERGSAEQLLRPGDTSTVDPGVEHWHGATAGGPMTHLAVTIGDVSWGEAPD